MKKALALSMALAMSAAMLAGCGGSASDSTSASSAASSADSAASGTPTVSFMIPDFTGHVLSNEHSDEVIAKYEAYTGTHVEWRTEANDTYSEKFGLTLMDKDNMPMILTATKTLDQNANAADAAKRGAFWNLTEYLQDAEVSWPRELASEAPMALEVLVGQANRLDDPARLQQLADAAGRSRTLLGEYRLNRVHDQHAAARGRRFVDDSVEIGFAKHVDVVLHAEAVGAHLDLGRALFARDI